MQLIIIKGNFGRYIITGKAEMTLLLVGTGNDTFVGGAGNDVTTGG